MVQPYQNRGHLRILSRSQTPSFQLFIDSGKAKGDEYEGRVVGSRSVRWEGTARYNLHCCSFCCWYESRTQETNNYFYD